MNPFHEILQEANTGHMANTAYDTAWIARIGEMDRAISNHALGWIAEHQLPDGSWGAAEPMYYHDRVICTLAAMTALMRRGRRASDRKQIDLGLEALERITRGATMGLTADPNGATVGFEMIAPTLVAEAENLGIIQRQGDRILGRLARQRAVKLAALQGVKINRFVTVAFSSEMAGVDGLRLLDTPNLQEVNGSVGHSPSATAYFVINANEQEPAAIQYLHSVITADGGAPNVAPFDIFERAWVLWNLMQAGQPDEETLALCRPHLDFLLRAWKTGEGSAWAAGYTPRDGDDTGLVYEVLSRFGCYVDAEAVLSYEGDEHFRCFALEANPSISANIHLLGALRQAGYPASHPSAQKILRFLARCQDSGSLWYDKWHASPYYASTHAVAACAGYADELVAGTIQWLVSTQGQDGSWGFYMPTAEETAYALQALVLWKRHGGRVPEEALQRGAAWLSDHVQPPYAPMWIGKCLYSPELVIRSAIWSALAMVRNGG